MTKRLLSALLAACLLPSLLTACARPADSEDSRREDRVVVVMNPESEPAAGFDPALGWGAGEHVHEPLIQSTLTVTNPDLSIGYDLATQVTSSDDASVWTVTIREDACFSDGVPLTAEDVAFTYNTAKASNPVADFTMLERAEAMDAYTVVFTLNQPFSVWPYTMATLGILPQHAYQASTYGQQPIGSGRYLLKSWDKGQQVILEANPSYYGEAPAIREVVILFMTEEAAYLAAKAGQADVCYTAASYTTGGVEGYSLLEVETVDNRGFNLPTDPDSNPVTADRALRQAINLGLDREALIEQVLYGRGTPAYSVCDKLPWYNPAAQVSCDPQAAAGLLEAGGWQMGEDGVRYEDGLKAAFPLLYPTGDSVRQSLAAAVAEQLAPLGIQVTPEGVGWDTAYTRALTQPLMWGWGAHTPMELYNIYHTAPDAQSARYSPYANAQVDAYMDAALAAPDLETAYDLWQKAQWDGTTGVTQEGDIPWVWLVNVSHLYWVRDGLVVAGQKIHPHGHGWSIVNNVDEWYWEA